MFCCRVFSSVSTLVVLCAFLSESFAAAPNIESKVVLANLDRYDAVLRFGTMRREIKPKKASHILLAREQVTRITRSAATRFILPLPRTLSKLSMTSWQPMEWTSTREQVWTTAWRLIGPGRVSGRASQILQSAPESRILRARRCRVPPPWLICFPPSHPR